MTDNIPSPLARATSSNNLQASSKLQTIQKHHKHQTTFPLNPNSDLAILSARFDLQESLHGGNHSKRHRHIRLTGIIKKQLKVSLISYVTLMQCVCVNVCVRESVCLPACLPACIMYARVHGPHAGQVERLQAPTTHSLRFCQAGMRHLHKSLHQKSLTLLLK